MTHAPVHVDVRQTGINHEGQGCHTHQVEVPITPCAAILRSSLHIHIQATTYHIQLMALPTRRYNMHVLPRHRARRRACSRCTPPRRLGGHALLFPRGYTHMHMQASTHVRARTCLARQPTRRQARAHLSAPPPAQVRPRARHRRCLARRRQPWSRRADGSARAR